jgi:two-component system, OmpR family, sensor histidine kinase ChvG
MRLPAFVGRLRDQIVRIRTRLLVINLVAVLVPVVGIEWARTYERVMLQALEDDMLHQAQLLRTLLEHNLDEQKRPRFEWVAAGLEPAAVRTRARVRLLDRAGQLIADSHAKGAPEGPEPPVPGLWRAGKLAPRRHPPERASTDPGPVAGRREILAARAGRLGTATRVHQRIHRVYLFLAMPVMVHRRVEGIVYITRSTVPAHMSMHKLRRQLFIILGVALGFTALLSLFLAATISRPLTRLTRATRRIAAGDRSASLHLQRRDEIGQLAQAFDALVCQLDGRAQYIAELAQNLSHEFKTPLASIRGASELLLDGAAEDPAARERFLQNILTDSERMTRLVTRILELSRIEASLEHRDELELGELIQEVAARFPEGSIAVELPGPLPLRANRAHLGSVLQALLENAVRYSPAGRPVWVRAELAAPSGELCLRVSDEGPGISAANQTKIFDRFFTTEAARGGTGLGLAIVATVVRAHGGTVKVESAPGQGAAFEVRLPRS